MKTETTCEPDQVEADGALRMGQRFPLRGNRSGTPLFLRQRAKTSLLPHFLIISFMDHVDIAQ